MFNAFECDYVKLKRADHGAPQLRNDLSPQSLELNNYGNSPFKVVVGKKSLLRSKRINTYAACNNFSAKLFNLTVANSIIKVQIKVLSALEKRLGGASDPDIPGI